MAGVLTREEVGAGYDQELFSLVKERFLAVGEGHWENRAAHLAGFKDWSAAQEALNLQDPGAVERRAELEALLARSVEVTARLEDEVRRVIEDGRYVRVWDPNAADNRTEWEAAMNLGGTDGLLRFTKSTRMGDRCFCLHFDSSHFPALEEQLDILKQEKSRFWSH